MKTKPNGLRACGPRIPAAQDLSGNASSSNGTSIPIGHLFLLVILSAFPGTAPAQTAISAGVSAVPLMDKVEHIGPHRYQGIPLGGELRFKTSADDLALGISLSFGIGALSRAEPDNELLSVNTDPETGLTTRKIRSTNHPLRIKAAVGFELLYDLSHGAPVRIFAGGSLAYRFDMSVFRDYPVFIGSLDLGPAVRAGIPLGSAMLESGIALPLVSLVNAPPYTGTNGRIIQDIYADPAAVVFRHGLATIVDRPLIQADFRLTVPVADRLDAVFAAALEPFLLRVDRNWSHLSIRNTISLGYRF